MYEDVKIIRLTFVTSFFHSLIVMFLIVLNLNNLLSKNYENWLYIWKVATYFVEAINRNHFIFIVMIITVSCFLAYSIIYPIWQAALIHYLRDKKSIRSALRKGLKDFFPMYEFSFISLILSPIVFWIALFRVIFLSNHISTFVIVMMILWFVVMMLINTLKSYARYCISLEGLPLVESLKKSYDMNRKDLSAGLKYMRVQTILLINFSINLILMLGIPLLLMYVAISFNAMDILWVRVSIYSIFFIMALVGSYMSSFIRAFFAYFWYKLYLQTIKKW